jgi:serine/threonine protein phosphatase PrpC
MGYPQECRDRSRKIAFGPQFKAASTEAVFMDALTMGLFERLHALFGAPPRDGYDCAGPAASLATLKGPREENQDRAFVAFLSRPSAGKLVLVGVLDGMGGMAEGAEAASVAEASFIKGVADGFHLGLTACVADAVTSANHAVWSRLRGSGGTTLTALAITDAGECRAIHVGDSRLYRTRPGPQQITTDDTLSGMFGLDDPLDSGLVQFVGMGERMLHQAFDLSTDQSEMLLLTSDGLHASVDWSCIGTLAAEPTATVKALTGSARAAGLNDNATVVAVNRPLAAAELGRFRGSLEVFSTSGHAVLALSR